MSATTRALGDLSCAITLTDGQSITPQFWGMQGAEPTLQFDNTGRIIFRMSTTSNGIPKTEIVRFDSSATPQIKVMVNSQIQVEKFFAAPRGGLYYVGRPVSGGSYFRYVDPSGVVRQIAEGSWGPLLFMPINNDPNDRVLYVGPYPQTQINPNSPPPNELLKFDPTAGTPGDVNRIFSQVTRAVTSGATFEVREWSATSVHTWENWVTACKSTSVNGIGNLGYQHRIIQEEDGSFLFLNDQGPNWGSFVHAPAGKVMCSYSDGSSTLFTGSEESCTNNKGASAFMAHCVNQDTPSGLMDSQTFYEKQAQASNRWNNNANTTPVVRLKASGTLEPILFPSGISIKKIWKVGSHFFYLHTNANGDFILRKWMNGNAQDPVAISGYEIYSLAKSGLKELIFSGLNFLNNESGVGYLNTDTLEIQLKDDVKDKVSDIIALE